MTDIEKLRYIFEQLEMFGENDCGDLTLNQAAKIHNATDLLRAVIRELNRKA
jgi:hypothetical protein